MMPRRFLPVALCALFLAPHANAQAIHDSDGITLQVYGDGSIGTQLGEFTGAGFTFSRVQSLFAASFFASQSETAVIGELYGVEWTQVAAPQAIPSPLPTPFQGFAQGFEARFNDANASPSLGLSVTQRSFSTSVGFDNHAVVLQYEIENTSSESRDGLYFSIGADFEVGTNAGVPGDFVGRDAASQSIYVYTNGAPYFGITLLSHEVSGSGPAFGGSSMDATLFQSSTTQPGLSSGSADQSAVIAAGPFDIAPSGTQTVTFALVAGSDRADFVANATALQGLNVSSEEEPTASADHFGIPVPNPASGDAKVSVTLASPEAVQVELIDVLGRTVATVHDASLPVGSTTLSVRTNGLSPGVYYLRARGESFQAVRTLTVTR